LQESRHSEPVFSQGNITTKDTKCTKVLGTKYFILFFVSFVLFVVRKQAWIEKVGMQTVVRNPRVADARS